MLVPFFKSGFKQLYLYICIYICLNIWQYDDTLCHGRSLGALYLAIMSVSCIVSRDIVVCHTLWRIVSSELGLIAQIKTMQS